MTFHRQKAAPPPILRRYIHQRYDTDAPPSEWTQRHDADAPRRANRQSPATAPEDTLKGVTAADIAALAGKRAAYSGADDAQGGVEKEIKQARADLDRIYGEACHLRIDLQLAADQAWPYTNPANAPVRAAFGIPEDRPASE